MIKYYSLAVLWNNEKDYIIEFTYDKYDIIYKLLLDYQKIEFVTKTVKGLIIVDNFGHEIIKRIKGIDF